jgi:hypothetical protein
MQWCRIRSECVEKEREETKRGGRVVVGQIEWRGGFCGGTVTTTTASMWLLVGVANSGTRVVYGA